MARLLGERGYAIEAVADGQAALESIRASRPDVLVTDVMMPRLDGFGLLHASMLNGLGYTVVEAASAEQALTLVQEGLSPDLVVSDHLMPGMNGADLAQAILSERPSIQVLIISGYAENDGISPGLPRLNKPFRYDELAACLARLQIDRVSHFGEPKWPEGLARTAPEWEVGGS